MKKKKKRRTIFKQTLIIIDFLNELLEGKQKQQQMKVGWGLKGLGERERKKVAKNEQ